MNLNTLMSSQRRSLARELLAAPRHLLDDYPGECYPTDILWAVAAIQRAARLENEHHDDLAARLIAVFNGPLLAKEGLPAFQVDAASDRILQHSRGCANSGLLPFAFELDPVIAARWMVWLLLATYAGIGAALLALAAGFARRALRKPPPLRPLWRPDALVGRLFLHPLPLPNPRDGGVPAPNSPNLQPESV
jgi:hypothetical protein